MTNMTKHKKEEAPSPESVYHTLASADADLASSGGALYRWTNGYWAAQDVAREESRAFSWLQAHYPSKTTPPIAKRCVEAAVMGAQELPRAKSRDIILPLLNGYLHVDMKTGESRLEAPDKAAGLTYMLNASFDQDADAPVFHEFLEQIFTLDDETQGWVQEFVGYTLIHDCRHQLAMFLVGSGANGKTTFTEIIAALHKKVVGMQLDRLDGFKLSPLIDASLVVVDETPQRINEQQLKTLISGGLSQFDIKYRNPVSFRPSAKWIILGNAVPAISDQSHGFWRRMPIVPFRRQFSTAKQDPNLARKIIDHEISGVLLWALTGLIRLIQRGRFPEPSEAMLVTQIECQRESNSVLAWWSDGRVELNLAIETPRSLIYADYKQWCTDNGMLALGVEKFWVRLKAIAGDEAVDAKPRKIQRQVVRVVPLLLLNNADLKTNGKIVAGRFGQ